MVAVFDPGAGEKAVQIGQGFPELRRAVIGVVRDALREAIWTKCAREGAML
jgi:hypothetical protein